MIHKVELEIGGRTLTIETGKLAKQSNGAVTVRYADSMVLCTVCAETEPKMGQDFFPLTVEYREKTYAAGKIPGGFFKREGRPNEKEVLTSRMIDRPLRPLFPDGYRCETQVIGLLGQFPSFDGQDQLTDRHLDSFHYPLRSRTGSSGVIR